MEQNEMIEEVQTKDLEVEKTVEESSGKEVENDTIEQTSLISENEEKGKTAEVETAKSGNPVTESESSEKADEIYQKLKTELMEEIRRYFDPIFKERKPGTEILNQEVILPAERENNLINRIINESGW